MPTFSHERRIWLRYTADGASLPTMTTASAGAWPAAAAHRLDVAGDGGPDLGGDRRAQQQSRAALGHRERHPRPASIGGRASPPRTVSRVCEPGGRSRPTRRSVSASSSRAAASSSIGGQVDVHVRGGGLRRREGQQGGDLEVGRGVAVAASGERLGERDDLEARLDGPVRGIRRAAGGLAHGGGACLTLRVGLAREPHRCDVAAVGLRVLVCEGEEPVGELPRRADRPRRAARRARRTSAGPRTATRPSRRGRPPGWPRRPRRCRRRARARRMRAGRRTRRPSGRGSACSVPRADCRDGATRRATRSTARASARPKVRGASAAAPAPQPTVGADGEEPRPRVMCGSGGPWRLVEPLDRPPA